MESDAANASARGLFANTQRLEPFDFSHRDDAEKLAAQRIDLTGGDHRLQLFQTQAKSLGRIAELEHHLRRTSHRAATLLPTGTAHNPAC